MRHDGTSVRHASVSVCIENKAKRSYSTQPSTSGYHISTCSCMRYGLFVIKKKLLAAIFLRKEPKSCTCRIFEGLDRSIPFVTLAILSTRGSRCEYVVQINPYECCFPSASLPFHIFYSRLSPHQGAPKENEASSGGVILCVTSILKQT